MNLRNQLTARLQIVDEQVQAANNRRLPDKNLCEHCEGERLEGFRDALEWVLQQLPRE